jgi:hypothetical protein
MHPWKRIHRDVKRGTRKPYKNITRNKTTPASDKCPRRPREPELAPHARHVSAPIGLAGPTRTGGPDPTKPSLQARSRPSVARRADYICMRPWPPRSGYEEWWLLLSESSLSWIRAWRAIDRRWFPIRVAGTRFLSRQDSLVGNCFLHLSSSRKDLVGF